MVTRKTTKTPPKKKAPARRKKKVIATPAVSPQTNQNISVRRISNGWIVRTETWTKGGKFTEKEQFTKTKPKINITE